MNVAESALSVTSVLSKTVYVTVTSLFAAISNVVLSGVTVKSAVVTEAAFDVSTAITNALSFLNVTVNEAVSPWF